MITQHRFWTVPVAAALVGLSLAATGASAQPTRITRPLDTSRRTILLGNRSKNALAKDDEGPLNTLARIRGLTLIFRPSAAQSRALDELLLEQQDPSSPNHNNWLTPEQYAMRFGLNPSDLEQTIYWLQTEGFDIDYVARSRCWIMFSGTAGQVQNTFHTELHRFNVQGNLHYANVSDPSLPTELAPLVSRLRGLDDFRTEPKPMASLPAGNLTAAGGFHSLAPGDLATIYNLGPLYQRGITGAGQKIAVAGQTDIDLSDIAHFRSEHGLPAADPQMMLVDGSADPGVNTDDLIESDLDLEYAGGIAPNATVLFVYSTDVWTSVEYAIDQDLAPVISTSYGFCEPQDSASPSSAAAYLQSLAKQANAMGITWVAASGDTGAADCDWTSEQLATHGLAVDLPASVPEVTGVGGTEFNEGNGRYWASANNSQGSSALTYIPEMAWNDANELGTLLSTGGGASLFFAKPAWQTGPGVPGDNARHVPDVSLAGAVAHDPYSIYANGAAMYVGGTSAPTPVFAGVLALANQYLVANGSQAKAGLGNINPVLYGLAQSTPGIFHDVAAGNNVVPCASESPNCNRGEFGFSAGAGYDQATGLGSMDVYNLVTLWNGPQPRPNSGIRKRQPHLRAQERTGGNLN